MQARHLVGIAVLSVCTAPLFAHHSVRATFSTDTLVTLTGTVRDMQWRNPHSYFTLVPTDSTDAASVWTIEMGAPSAIVESGLSRDFLEAGDAVSLEVWVAMDGTRNAHARVITFADGTRIELPEDRWTQMSGPSPD